MFEIISTFIYSSWQDIIIGSVTLILSYYPTKKYLVSAEKERFKQAKKCLLHILEKRIKNKQDVSVDMINNFLESIGRKYSVALSDVVFVSSLLQDLQLRFESNSDLGPAEKDECYKHIQKMIQEIRLTGELLVLPEKYSEIIDVLTEEIKTKNTENALENLELLKRKITKREKDLAGFGSFTISTSILVPMIALTYLFITIFNINFVLSIFMSYTVIVIVFVILEIVGKVVKSKQFD